jgi:hypothetical protein
MFVFCGGSDCVNQGQDHVRFASRALGRRDLLRLGGTGCLSISFAPVFEGQLAGAARPRARSAGHIKSCIVLYYYGGPSHLDTWDMKPEAPREVRGEFSSIATRVPGVRVCEYMPHCSRVTDKLAIIRSMHHPMRNHNSAAVESLCGRTPLNGDLELLNDNLNSFPCYGAIVTSQRPGNAGVPTHVALPHVMYNVVQLPGQTAGFLGAAYNPFQVSRDPNEANFGIDGLDLPADLPLARLDNRRSLLSLIDAKARCVENSIGGRAMTGYQERAFNLIRSVKVRRAFDLSAESDRLRQRYGRNKLGQSLLLARRLVEADVRFINVNDKITNGQVTNWDSHENNFGRLKSDLLPEADQAFSALIEDLAGRGLLESTLVIALAEFGRTPRINRNAGRDHWPDCFSVVLAGGGIRGGVIYGASDRIGAYPALDPVSPGDLAATIFWRFGLDPLAEMRDLAGRPYRLADGEPLVRLFS